MSAGSKATKVNVISCMSYDDPEAAIAWLEEAFGFTPFVVYRDDSGAVMHAELVFGNGMIMIGPSAKGAFSKRFMAMPRDCGNRCTQAVCVVVDNVDAHHARAVAAGAEIVMNPEDQSYGARTYAARDLGGHVWSFGDYDPWAAKPSAS
ncbi:MAG TPA: VOC family protein [Hyphomicrobium sp.]|nr:VOC family protein [Hyphomicrobium sp.]